MAQQRLLWRLAGAGVGVGAALAGAVGVGGWASSSPLVATAAAHEQQDEHGDVKTAQQQQQQQQQESRQASSSPHVSAVDRETSTLHLDDGRALKLVQVQVYFRHGARTPIHGIPGDVKEEHWDERLCGALPDVERPLRITGPDNGPRPICAANLRQRQTKLPGGCHIGCLTLLGRHEAFSLGHRLREQYMDEINFLTSYHPEQVKVRSTNFDRTIETARLVVSGLFGAKGMHVQVSTVPVDEEHLSPNTRACPRLRELFVEARKNREKDRSETGRALRDRLANALGADPKEVHFVGIRDAVIARHAHSKEVPPPLTGEMRKLVDQHAVEDVAALFKYRPKEALSLTCGRLFQNMLGFFSEAKKGTSPTTPRMRMFSCHDTTIMPMLLCMGIFDGKWPPFASDICVELYRDENSVDDHYVRVLYLGQPQRLPLSTSEFCSYEVFERGLSSFVPKDFKQACRVQHQASSGPASQGGDTFKV